MNKLDIVRRIVSDTLQIAPESIQAEDLIVELKNIDSLSFETIVVAIEEQAGKPLEPARLVTLSTVGDLAKLLE